MAEEAPKTGHAPPTTASLMESAKTVAEAAQSPFKEGGALNKAKVAEAAENVLEGAKSYGKLDDKSGVGQYVTKAEDYLHQYHGSDAESTPAPAAEAKVEEVAKKEEESSGGVAAGAGDLLEKAKKGLGGLFS